jgi:hypothetical protein
MSHGSYSLGEAAAKLRMVRLRCSKCGRTGRYRIDRLIEKYAATSPCRTSATSLRNALIGVT